MCAFTISEDDHFSYINDILDAGGRTKTKTDSRKMKYVQEILKKNHIRKSEITKYELLSVEDYLDYNETDFIIKQFKKKAERTGFQGSISKTLHLLGFTKAKSDQVENILEPFLDSSYTRTQIIDMAIEQIFGFLFNTIGDINSNHYFRSSVEMDEWFINENGFNIINTSFKPSIKERENVNDLLVQLRKESPIDDTLYFHTTTWEHAISIMHKIDHNSGRKCLDFGILPGFYMGTRIKDTLEWGERFLRSGGNKAEVATIIFSLPKKYTEDIHYREFSGENWEYIVSASRKCQAPPFRKELPEIENLDFIYGYMASNPDSIKYNNSSPKKFPDNKKQLVSKTDKGDAYLQNKIIGAVFYRKN